MTDATAAKVSLVLLALEHNQQRGHDVPQPGDPAITPGYLARLSATIGHPVSEETFRKIERDAIRKLQLSLLTLEALTHLHRHGPRTSVRPKESRPEN